MAGRFLLLLCVFLAACRLAPATALKDEDVRARVADRMVTTLEEQDHYFGDEEDRREFAERMRAIAETQDDAFSFYREISHALADLNEGHTTLVSSVDVPFLETVPPASIVEVAGEAVVAGTAPGVEGGGLRPGDVIVEIDGVAAQEAIDARVARTPGSTAHGRRARAVSNILAGPTRDPAYVRVRGMDGRVRDAYPLRFLLDDGGIDRFRFGFVRETVLGTRLDLATGYVALPEFRDEHLEALSSTLQHMSVLPRIVLDLRGNPGGSIRVLQKVAGHFVAEDSDLVLLRDGGRETTFSAIASIPRYEGRLYILVDERTGSAAELLAAALRDLGRARVVGRQTAGSTRSRLSTMLPGGVVFHYGASAEFRRSGGERIEGLGVVPDAVVHPDREALAAGSYGDPLRDEAIQRACGLD
jgi:carboxyl-terminal processing protease